MRKRLKTAQKRGVTPTEKKALIKKLSAKRVSYVSYKKDYLSLKFDGRILRNKVIIRHEPGIGNWSRKRNEIYYDESLQVPDVLPVLVHESVEKYVTQRYSMRTQSESHKVAMAVEKRFVGEACSRRYKEKCTHKGRCWRRHEMRIQGLWLSANKLNIKRRKIKVSRRAVIRY